MPRPEYAIDIGTPVHGEFSYDLASVDTAVSNADRGIYPQVEPYHLKFQIGDFIFFQTDPHGPNSYRVSVENDDSSVAPTRDHFQILGVDSVLAASYGIDNVHAILHLQDLTAQAVDDDSLPTDLSGFDQDAFGAGWLFLNGISHEGDIARVVFGYRFRIDAVERLLPEPLLIGSDIKPGSDRNAINPSSRGVVPVAALGSSEFSVEEIDPTTLAFGPDFAPPAHAVGGHHRDVNADGFLDLVAHFRIEESGIAMGDTQACISGEVFEGMLFIGCDAIRAVPAGQMRSRAR
jgi:hypothetical protein